MTNHLTSLEKYGEFAMKKYGIEVLKGRAVPSLIDGLKPVQRRILWSMYKLGLKPKAKTVKAARIVGSVMGLYHPHGDMAIYGAMVTMENSCQSYIDGNGSNWGTLTNGPAANRYTEGRLSEYAWKNFFDGDYVNLIEFQNNYDDTRQEPISLISNTCNLLVNGTYGIAVGATCNIPSFTLKSVNKLICKAIKKKLTVNDVVNTLEFQLPYGGKFQNTPANKKAFQDLVANGYGSIQFEPIIQIFTKQKQAIVTGFTNQLRSGKILEKIAAHDAVQLLKDETSIEYGNRFVISLKKSIVASNVQKTFEQVLRPFYTRETYRISYLTDKVIQKGGEDKIETRFVSTSIIQLVEDWLNKRRAIEDDLLLWQISQLKKRKSQLDLFRYALDNRDTLDECRDKDKPKSFLIKTLKISDKQADLLLNLTVKQLTKISSRNLDAEIARIKDAIRNKKTDRKNIDALLIKRLK